MAARRRSSRYGLMAEVANDDKVAKLSAAQQAAYLRNVEGENRNAKALARRALGHGLEFAATLHNEVRAMHAHFGANVFLSGPGVIPDGIAEKDPDSDFWFTVARGETTH